MGTEKYLFNYEVFESAAALSEEDRRLLKRAQTAAGSAYAPYSNFRVGAAAELVNGETVTGSNQENASYPAGICAEGTTLSVASSLFPGVAIKNMAISYESDNTSSDHPVAPCGIRRQQLHEFADRTGAPIRLIMSGQEGKVVVLQDANALLPFSFKF